MPKGVIKCSCEESNRPSSGGSDDGFASHQPRLVEGGEVSLIRAPDITTAIPGRLYVFDDGLTATARAGSTFATFTEFYHEQYPGMWALVGTDRYGNAFATEIYKYNGPSYVTSNNQTLTDKVLSGCDECAQEPSGNAARDRQQRRMLIDPVTLLE
jgi:hypothetical protein